MPNNVLRDGVCVGVQWEIELQHVVLDGILHHVLDDVLRNVLDHVLREYVLYFYSKLYNVINII